MPHYLAPLFAPNSVAVVGASRRRDALGHIVLANIIGNGFAGRIVPVTPRHHEVMGLRALPDLGALDAPVDLAVFCTPAELTLKLIDALDPSLVRSVLVLTAGFAEMGAEGRRRSEVLARILARKGIRMVGPNCLGILRPSIGLNASFAPTRPDAGKLALVSQSGAACTVMLDWASARGIGFSSVISMGGALDLDFGEILDFLIHDPATEHILMYVEGVRDARGFVSSLRAAARTKPVIVLKVGRHASGSRAASSHTGALVGSDAVFSAVFDRCGTIRVLSMNDLFTAASILAEGRMPRGDRLAVVTNGGGPGVLAADRAADRGVPLAKLSETTIESLNAILPAHWSHDNPVDVIGDADAARYAGAARVLAESHDCDVILGLYCPVAVASASEVARATIDIASATRKPFVTAWLGETEVAESRRLFAQVDIPSFRTPESAVDALSYLVQFRRNQALLLQTPPPRPPEAPFDRDAADAIRERARAEGRTLLSETESKQLLALFDIPVAANLIARSADEAVACAERIGYPAVMKINSRDISHKSDLGGVRLNLLNARTVRRAYREMLAEIGRLRPDAHIDGVAMQPMLRFADQREVFVGLARDPVFGATLSFGTGGVAIEAVRDTAVALPPLNEGLARHLIGQTRVSRLLGQVRTMRAADETALVTLLLRVSHLACELPWIAEMDLNPVLAHPEGAVVVDARIVLDPDAPQRPERYRHLAIHPYPEALASEVELRDGARLEMRPIRPEDAELERRFVENLSDRSRYFRFMHYMNELSPQLLARFTQIDYDREMALVAVDRDDAGAPRIVAVTRYSPEPDGASAEFAVVVADAYQGRGLGTRMLARIAEIARTAGYRKLVGSVLTENKDMRAMVERLGFRVVADNDPETVRYELAL